MRQSSIRLHIVEECLISGKPAHLGEVWTVDPSKAFDLIGCKRAVLAEGEKAEGYRLIEVSPWRDLSAPPPEPECIAVREAMR